MLPFQQNLIGQALLGSDWPVLDYDLLDENLRKAVEDMAAQGEDGPTTLLKQISLILSADCTRKNLDLNSLPLPRMEQYQSLLENLGMQGKHKPNLKALLKKPNLTSEERTLLQDVEEHQGPVPLMMGTAQSRPTFPQPINNLVKLAVDTDNTGLLLFWLLRKLSTFDMEFSAEAVVPLLNEYFNPDNGGVRFESVLVSRYMQQELLIKLGGAAFRYVLPLHTQNKLAALLCEKMNDLAAHNELNFVEGKGAVKGLYPELPLDYTALFKKASLEDAIGMLIKLRWTNPALSRAVLPEKLQRCSLENRAYYLRQLGSNLSLDDEDFLMQELTAPTNLECHGVAAGLLSLMGSPQYSKLCLQLCSKYLSFDGSEWHLQGCKHNAESEALGIEKYSLSISATQHSQMLLKHLLHSLTWEDLRTLAKAQTDLQAFKHWLMLDNAQHIPQSQDLEVLCIVGSSINKTGSEENRKTFIDFVGNKLPSLVDADYLASVRHLMSFKFLMHLDLKRRECFLPYYTNPQHLPASWFAELADSPYEFKTLDTQWSFAVAQRSLELTKGRLFSSEIALLGMYLSSDMIAFFKEQRPKIQKLLEENEAMAENVSAQSSLEYFLKKGFEYKGKLNMLDRVLAYLEAKRHIEQVIEQELGEVD